MFAQIASILPRSAAGGDSILIADEVKSDGSFLIHHFISAAIRQVSGGGCIVVSLSQIFHHYVSIQRKLVGRDIAHFIIIHRVGKYSSFG
jgi:hypothetical protein